jgi:hypothetical protein
MWSAAWSAAQVQALRRSEALAAARDAALLELQTMVQDVAGLVATVDDQDARLAQADAQAATLRAEHLASLEQAEAEKAAAVVAQAEMAQELERTRAELAQVQAEAEHALQLADAGRDLLRQELARLTDQVGELKAALYKRADAATA